MYACTLRLCKHFNHDAKPKIAGGGVFWLTPGGCYGEFFKDLHGSSLAYIT